MNKDTAYTIEPPRSRINNPERVVVTFPPTQVSGETHTRAQRPELAAFGRVVSVSYSRDHIDRQRIIKDTFEKLKKLFRGIPNKELCLIGSSLGGQLVVDFDRYNRQMGSPFNITGLIAVDPPMGTADVTIPGIRASKVVQPGKVTNASLGWMVKVWHNPPTPEEGVDLGLLREHHQASRNWPWSGIASAGRAITTFTPVEPGELAHIPNRALLRSKHDKDVAESATPKWQKALGVPTVVRVESTHCDWPAFPKAWNKALVDTLRGFYPNG